jgi:aminoglycoside phosphotransferase (APT) family kinase protein
MCKDEMGTQMCIKFYEDSATGKSSLRRHAQLLEVLHGAIPVPKILGLEEEAYRFGLPALVTTFIGASLERSIGAIAGNPRVKLTEDIATSVATLTKLSAKDAGLSDIGLKELNRSVAKMFTDDAHWYTAHVGSADSRASGLVLRGAEILATKEVSVQKACLAHRDLTAYNITTKGQTFSGIIDWDHAGIASPEEDLGKCILGLLVPLPIPTEERIEMVQPFLQRYCSLTGFTMEKVYAAPLAFALDAALDWLIGGKNAPMSELVWATSLILDSMVTKCLGGTS